MLLLLNFSVFSSRDLYDRSMQYYDDVEQNYTKAFSAFEYVLKLIDLDVQTILGIMIKLKLLIKI